MQKKRLDLSLTKIRWLQEMGIAPAMLRAHMQEPSAPPRPVRSSSVLPRLSEQLEPVPDKPAERPEPPVEPMTIEPTSIEAESFAGWCEAVQHCQSCARSQSRVRVFTGVGQSQQPEWFVLGSAPTRQDEAAGQAWQSAAGQLLMAQLQAIGLDPDQQVYCSYALKCYAPATTPDAQEIEACKQVFLQELGFVQPRRLLVLGQSAVEMLFGSEARLNDLRGTVQQWQPADEASLPVVVAFDPASLLLRPQQKAQAWQDLLLMRTLMSQSA